MLLCVMAAVAVWGAFYPAIMSSDSLDQYAQAYDSDYDSVHPPVMSVVIAGVLRCGGNIALLMLGQCLVGLLGLRALLMALLRHFTAGEMPPAVRSRTASGLALLFLVPLSPLAYYLMTFWKDAWLAVTLLWIGALSVGLWEDRDAHRGLTWYLRFVLLLLAMAMAVLVRHNAAVLLPVFGVLCAVIVYRSRRFYALLAALLPLVGLAAGTALIHRIVTVRPAYPEYQVMGLDLVGLCYLDPQRRSSLPYTDSCLTDDLYRTGYRFGEIGPLAWYPVPLVRPEYLGYVNRYPENKALTREYWHAVCTYPFGIMEVKVRAFVRLLGWSGTPVWVHSFFNGLDPNRFGLAPPAVVQPLRTALLKLADFVSGHPWLRWVSGVHLVWLAISWTVWLVVFVWWWYRRTAVMLLRLALVSLPAAYYFSHLLAVVVPDFRFMYPATLFTQALVAAWLVARIYLLFRRKPAPAPVTC